MMGVVIVITEVVLGNGESIHRCDKIMYLVVSSLQNSRTLVRRSTHLPEWNNPSLWRNASMLMRCMLPVAVPVSLGQTMVECGIRTSIGGG